MSVRLLPNLMAHDYPSYRLLKVGKGHWMIVNKNGPGFRLKRALRNERMLRPTAVGAGLRYRNRRHRYLWLSNVCRIERRIRS